MTLDRRKFLSLGAGAIISSQHLRAPIAAAEERACMLALTESSGFTATPLMTTGDAINGYRAPGIMDGMAAWEWGNNRVRLFVTHELPPHKGYLWKLTNGTGLTGARISWFDIDRDSRRILDAGNAVEKIYDRQGRVVTDPRQVNEHQQEERPLGLNVLCSAQGYRRAEMGFTNDIMFVHEEVSAREDHPHGGSVWALDIRTQSLWALPALGRGSWENVTAVTTPDQDAEDGHIALLMGDDLEFGRAPLYLWIGRKLPAGDFPARNGLREGQLFVWSCDNGDLTPQDWHGSGTKRPGSFIPIATRNLQRKNQPGYDAEGWLDDLTLREQARARKAFMFSRPEDLHTNPANGLQVVLCSTGQGNEFPADDWGTVYIADISFNADNLLDKPRATLRILHDCDDVGDFGIRSADNVVWATDGMIYIHEDRATKLNEFGGESGRDTSTWRINPEDPEDCAVVAIVNRSVVLPRDARDEKAGELGPWECCGLIDVSAQFGSGGELVMVTAVQAHSVRGGSLGGEDDLVQGGQLVLLTRAKS